VDKVVGVVKAYTTRVGSGPFPTELTDARGGGNRPCRAPETDIGLHLQTVGAEVGVTYVCCVLLACARTCFWFHEMIFRRISSGRDANVGVVGWTFLSCGTRIC
jgi:adenylosuccinate synthase